MVSAEEEQACFGHSAGAVIAQIGTTKVRQPRIGAVFVGRETLANVPKAGPRERADRSRPEEKAAARHVGFRLDFSVLAESEGFEPPIPFGTPDFESGAFSRSASSPDLQLYDFDF
jgi:hypothetical protein